MRRPSAKLTPNTVTIQRTSFGRDLAAGRKIAIPPDPALYRCAVQPTSAEDVEEHLREQECTYFTVKFYDGDPGVRNRDQITDDLGRVLVVLATKGTSGGVGRTWEVLCAYRRPPGG